MRVLTTSLFYLSLILSSACSADASTEDAARADVVRDRLNAENMRRDEV